MPHVTDHVLTLPDQGLSSDPRVSCLEMKTCACSKTCLLHCWCPGPPRISSGGHPGSEYDDECYCACALGQPDHCRLASLFCCWRWCSSCSWGDHDHSPFLSRTWVSDPVGWKFCPWKPFADVPASHVLSPPAFSHAAQVLTVQDPEIWHCFPSGFHHTRSCCHHTHFPDHSCHQSCNEDSSMIF